jgi:hypothetical protein
VSEGVFGRIERILEGAWARALRSPEQICLIGFDSLGDIIHRFLNHYGFAVGKKDQGIRNCLEIFDGFQVYQNLLLIQFGKHDHGHVLVGGLGLADSLKVWYVRSHL